VAVTTIRPPHAVERSGSPRLAALLSACAAALCVSVAGIVLFLAIASLSGLRTAFIMFGPMNVFHPLLATIYVTVLALPLTAGVGILAAVAVSDARIFGSAVGNARAAITIMGSIPTVVTAVAAASAIAALGQQPTLTAGAIALAFVNMPLMTALATSALAGGAPDLREAAAALGASPMYAMRRVLLPGSGLRLGAAILIVATQMIGGAAVIAIVTGSTATNSTGSAPVGAWPLAVDIWSHGADAYRFGVTAVGALALIFIIWLMQGVAQLRQAPWPMSSQESR
jgi:phosphate transport system permease protein